jgi:branched-chain amino acid transport system permease protein
LLQLIATFGVVLLVKDAALALWGAEDLLGPRAPGLAGTIAILGQAVPQYDLLLIVLAPIVLAVLSLALARTRWGLLVRATTEDRAMVGSLGVNPSWLFSGVFFVGALLAGLAGALQLPREPANLNMDLTIIADVFVVTVVGGLGSIGGAFVAALIIGVVKAACIAAGDVAVAGMVVSFAKLTLIAEFVVMAAVLVVRPWGLYGQPPAPPAQLEQRALQTPPGRAFAIVLALLLAALAVAPVAGDEYALVLGTDMLVFALFAVSLHFIMGPGGMASFGHAAYFGLGAYAAALAARTLPMELALIVAPFAAGVGALVFGWFCVRLSGVYLAMLTLAFAQITWATVYQWDALTGGSNGLVGVWPAAWLSSSAAYYWLTLIIAVGAIALLWRVVFAPFGYALRATRDSPRRAAAVGIDVRTIRWAGFVIAGLAAGLAGSLYAFSKGSISPESLSIPRSVDGLVMVLLGGLQTLFGPVAGAAMLSWLQDTLARHTEYWRAMLGTAILLLVLVFPQGVIGALDRAMQYLRQRRIARAAAQ